MRRKKTIRPLLIICNNLAELLGHEDCDCLRHSCTCSEDTGKFSLISSRELGVIALFAAVVTLLLIAFEIRAAQLRRRRYVRSVWMIYATMAFSALPSLVISYLVLSGRSVWLSIVSSVNLPSPPSLWTPAAMTTLMTKVIPTFIAMCDLTGQQTMPGPTSAQQELPPAESLDLLHEILSMLQSHSMEKEAWTQPTLNEQTASSIPSHSINIGEPNEQSTIIEVPSVTGTQQVVYANGGDDDEPTIVVYMYEDEEGFMSLFSSYRILVGIVAALILLAILRPRIVNRVIDKSRTWIRNSKVILLHEVPSRVSDFVRSVSRHCSAALSKAESYACMPVRLTPSYSHPRTKRLKTRRTHSRYNLDNIDESESPSHFPRTTSRRAPSIVKQRTRILERSSNDDKGGERRKVT